MCLNLIAEQLLFKAPALASDVNRPLYPPAMAAEVVVSKNYMDWLGKSMQVTNLTVWLSSKRAS